jgi:hypothetical protein
VGRFLESLGLKSLGLKSLGLKSLGLNSLGILNPRTLESWDPKFTIFLTATTVPAAY